MTGKILKAILTVAIAVLLLSFLVITGLLYRDFTQMQQNQLEDKLLFAAAATQQSGEAYLQQLPQNAYRLTWILPDGSVAFDSLADSSGMENHADREEIQEARTAGRGDSLRYSATLMEKTLYKAVLLDDGSVLRISVSTDTAAAMMIELLWSIVVIAVFAIVLSAWLARRMAKQVTEPLNRLNLDEPMENDTYEELTPLLQRISSQHQEIALQMQLLKCKQQEFDKITENMKEALVLLSADHRIVSINPAAVCLFETASTSEGKLFTAEQYEPEMSRAIQTAVQCGHAEFTASVKESKYLFNLSSIVADSTVHGIVILAFDVTEQAHAEQIRRDFTANVSHELKTPLQAIIGSAELIENGIVQPQDLTRFIGHIRKEASRLLDLIEDILRLAQLDAGNTMPMEEVSLWALANEVQEVLQYAAEEKQITLTVCGDPGVICGVQSLLFELIYNLADNGIRYNKAGGSVQISVENGAEEVRLCVTDTGIGIAQEHLPHIFDRFYRVDKSHSRKSGGTGLGMSIVKHTVKHHRGTLHIDSEVGKGTKITVSFQKKPEKNSPV